MAKRECENYLPPARIIEGLYFVGTYKASSHIFDTGAGLALIDSGYERDIERLLENIRAAGYNPADIKYILLSHGHVDHAEATAALLRECRAEVYLGEGDLFMVEDSFTPHHLLSGEVELTLGEISVKCVPTPGHTDGTYSFFFEMEDSGRRLRVGMHGGVGTNTLTDEYLEKNGLPRSNRQLMRDGLLRVRGERVDVFIGNHTWNNDTDLKIAAVLDGDRDAFVDPAAWIPFIDSRIRAVDKLG